MTLAIISDLHANLPAVEATLSAIDGQHPDAIYCLGDLVNFNVWNNEVVELVKRRKIPTVQGNHDEGIAQGRRYFKFSYTFPEARKWGMEAIDYTIRTVTAENKAFLASLPFSLRLDIPHAGSRPFTILLVHGSPVDIHDNIMRHQGKARYIGFLDIAGTDMLLCGQCHTPYHYVFPGEGPAPVIHRHIANPGSVGRPRDGDWRSSYLLLELDQTRDLQREPDAVRTRFYKMPYDLDKAVKAIRHSELAVYYGGRLIIGE
ncbi:MAG TPA: metallophosphoesterase family protein [Puia sp.]|nr:metallophosphoesterase family protein [Puia sp.]